MQSLCNIYKDQEIIVYKLDKNKYPVFRIKHFFASYDYELKMISTLLLADIEGSIPNFEGNKNSFSLFLMLNLIIKIILNYLFVKLEVPKK